MTILIRKVKEPHGWLGNMSPYSIELNGKRFRTSEALFQAMRFEDEDVIEEIRAEKSPMAAKFVAKRNKERMVIEPCGETDIENMRECLRLKVSQHPELKELLLGTGGEDIIEDCSKRRRGSGLFWGAALKKDAWEGQNWLGTLWMEQRAKLRCSLMAA
jgi:N-glycosidase YbiA